MAKRKYYRIDGTIEDTDQEKNNKTLASINKMMQKEEPALAKVNEPIYKPTVELSFENKNTPLTFDTTKKRVDYVKPEGPTLDDKIAYLGKKTGSGVLKAGTSAVDAALQETQNNLQKGAEKGAKWYTNPLNTTLEVAGMLSPWTKMQVKQLTKQFDKEYQKKNWTEKLLDNINDVNEALSIPGIKEAIQGYGALDKEVLGGTAPENIAKLSETVNKPSEDLQKSLAEESKNYSKLLNFSGDVLEQVGNMAPSIAVTALTKDPNLGLAAMGLSAKGGSTREALQQGASLDDAIKIGNAKALVEVGTEKLTGGLNYFGKGALDDIVTKGVDKAIRNKGLNFLAKQGLAILGEQSEEVLADVVGTLIDKGTINPNAKYTWDDLKNTLVQTAGSTFVLNLLGGNYSRSAYNQNINEMNENTGSNALYNEYKTNQEQNNKVKEQSNQNKSELEITAENKLNENLQKQYEKQNRNEIQENFAKNDIVRELRNDGEYQNALDNIDEVNNVLENQKNLDNTEQMVYNETRNAKESALNGQEENVKGTSVEDIGKYQKEQNFSRDEQRTYYEKNRYDKGTVGEAKNSVRVNGYKVDGKNVTTYGETVPNTNFNDVHEVVKSAKESNPYGAYVDLKEDYSKYKNFTLSDGSGNVSVTPDGDIVSVVKNPDSSVKNASKQLLLTALENGGVKLDNYDGFLTDNYQNAGFIPVAKSYFIDEYAPADWNYDEFGRPYVIAMVHNGDSVAEVAKNWGKYGKVDIESLPTMEYNEMIKYRDSIIEAMKDEGTTDSSFSNVLDYQEAEEKIAKILDKAPKEKNKLFSAENRENARQEFIRAFVDKGETIKRIADATKNPNLYWLYDRMGLSRNEAQSRIGNAQTDLNGKLLRNFKDADGNKVTMSIQGIIDDAEANGISTQVLNEYLANYLNVDRYSQGKPVFGNSVDDYTSSKRIKALETAYPEINRIANNVWQFNKNQLQMMVDSGLISKEFAKELQQKNPHYVRIQRDVENKKSKGPIIDKNGNIKVNQQIQTAKGSDLDILPIMETMADFSEKVNTSARRNIFGKELAKTLSMGVEDTSISPIVSEESFGINPDLIKDNGDGTYSMTVFDDGVATVVPINKGIYDALTPNKAIQSIENNLAFKILAWTPKKMSAAFRTMTTDKNPVFLATNFFKDIGDAPFNSKYTSTFYKNYAKAVQDRITGGNYTQLYLNLGGNQNSYFADGEFTSKSKSKVGKAVDTALKPIEVGNEYIESFPRIAEFMSTIEANGYTVNENCELVPIKGKKQKASPDVVLNEALYNSAEITTNFKRGGDVAKFLNRNGATFLNASIQGFSKQIRNFTDIKSPKQAVMLMTKALIFGIAPTLLNDAMYGDDDEYKEMQEYQKDNYFLFKGKDGKWIRIPKGRAMSVLGSLARRTKNFIGGDKNAYSGFVDFAKNQIAPNSILENNIFSAISQVKNNKSWSGNKIISDSMAKKPTDEQYNEKTDDISKFLGKVLKDVPLPKEYKNFKSPMAINYLIDQYTGGIGDVVLPMISQKATSTDNPLVAPFTNKFTTDAAYSSKAIGDYYDKKDELETNKSSDKATPLDKAKYSYMNSKNYEIAALYGEQRAIQSDTSLSKKEKYKQAKAKQEEINKLAKQIVKDVDKASESDYYVKIGDYYYKKVIKDGKETYVRDTSKNIPTESYALYDYFKSKYDKSKE